MLPTLYEKPQNLYLYIPPHSSHPRGVFTGLIFGQVLRIRRLCSKRADADAAINQFFHRLCDRGHTADNLLPLFKRAEANAADYLARSPEEKESLKQQKEAASRNQLFFHLQYIIRRTLLPQRFKPFGKSLSLTHLVTLLSLK